MPNGLKRLVGPLHSVRNGLANVIDHLAIDRVEMLLKLDVASVCLLALLVSILAIAKAYVFV
jgi:hypothetical protein